MSTGFQDDRRLADAEDLDLDREPPAREARRAWPVVLAVTLVLALLAGGYYVVSSTSLLGLRDIAVSGADPSLADAVRLAADEPEGTPLLLIDTNLVRARIGGLPQVESVTVERSWPHSLLVTVVSRVAVAVTQANGSLWLMDSTGVPFQKVDAAPSGLVTLELATPAPGDPATRAALTVANAFTSDFRAEVSTVSAPTAHSVSLTLKDGKTVVWGGPDNSAEKMRILPAVLQQPGQTYDVSVPDMVVVH